MKFIVKPLKEKGSITERNKRPTRCCLCSENPRFCW